MSVISTYHTWGPAASDISTSDKPLKIDISTLVGWFLIILISLIGNPKNDIRGK
ncbi:MAG: hypothetical protein IPN86_20795 [Saprospiraceae bacterium]|nr:hypothetical protein [Saprospiraceae bacterium]